MASLPYVPTVILTPPASEDLVYILQTDSDSTDVQFKAVNISASLSTSNLVTTDVTDKPPFSTSDGSAFTAFTGAGGDIFVIAGQCTKGLAGASVWTFQPAGDGPDGDWAQAALSSDQAADSGPALGSFYLAAGTAFSSNPNGTQDLYYFGGMCPTTSDSTVTTWQSSANYSDTVLYMEPSSDQGSSMYNVEPIAARGPPIAEAGFTMTPLSPTYFNSSSGNVSMQQNFVLIGGHTQTAFINMSQVAIMSLPEQSWSFVPVNNPDSNSVEPRSGHTAVLSDDGQSVVVFGGWVGDVNTPADPQLAVLQIGDGYGGSGNWQWTIPAASGTGPNSGGIYGHGAAMLPGNVMMISGGLSIGSTSGELVRRAEQQTYLYNISSNSWISSYTNPKKVAENSASSSSGGPSESTKTGLGVGLGVGLALLIALVLGFLWYRHRQKKKRVVRDEDLRGLSLGNDHRLQSSMLGYSGIDGNNSGRPMRYADDPYGRGSNMYPWAPTLNEGAAPNQTRQNQAERTGVLVEIPSPTRGLRRSLHSRGYQWHEDGRRSRGSSHIHPIDERDEDEDGTGAGEVTAGTAALVVGEAGEITAAEMVHITPAPLFSRASTDPFADPPEQRSLLDGSRSPSPTSPLKERDVEILGAAIGSTAEHDHPSPEHQHSQGETGRLSPNDKSDRTSSTLSDQSARSMVSALSQPPPSSRGSISRVSMISRGPSQRSTTLFSSQAQSSAGMTSPPSTDFGMSMGSPHRIKRRPLSMQSPPPQHPRAALAPGMVIGSSPSAGGRPATPTFSQLQAEGPALLYGNAGGSPGSASYSVVAPGPGSPQDNDFDAEPLPNRKAARPRSWMGSMRRALGGATGVGRSSSPGRDAVPRFPLTGGNGGGSGGGSSSASGGSKGEGYAPVSGDVFADPSGAPEHPHHERRASMGEMWAARRQQGARDWGAGAEASGSGAAGGSHSAWSSGPGPWSGLAQGEWLAGSSSSDATSASARGAEDDDYEGAAGGEWDVESAVESRVVQLMFTVPRERLRVVNAAPEPEGEAASLRSGPSVRSVTSAASRASVRSGGAKSKGAKRGARGIGAERSVGSLRRVFEVEKGEPSESGAAAGDVVAEGTAVAAQDKGKGKEKMGD